MTDKEKREQTLIDMFGMNRASYKWILPGAEILKYIDQVIMCMEVTKKETGEWNTDFKPCVIKEICNFNPLTMTYRCFYQIDGEIDLREIEIIPEGFSFGDPNETGKMIRFIPYSLHCEMTEREIFLDRVKNLYETRSTLSVESLKNLQESKEQDKTLRYCCNVGMAVKLASGKTLWIRLHKISINHRQGTKYSLRLESDKDTWNYLVDMKDEVYDFESGLGTFKLIDLRTNDR